MPRKIYEISIDEITLCKSPSNKKLFFIKKSQEKNMTFIEKLKKFLTEADQDVEATLTKEEVERIEKLDEKIQKELEEKLDIVSQYEDIPDDLEESIQFFVKKASFDYPEIEEELGKAGAKLSKTTQAQIKEALGHIKDGPKAIVILEALLGKEVKKKKEDDKENLSPETLAKLEEYEDLKKAKDEEIAKQTKKEADERVVELVNEALKKAGMKEIPKKKSIDDPGEKKLEKKTEADDEKEDKWPSVYVPGLPETED